jgi:acyl-CoA reductase-like NAD-dependent aldehyde dehydrogenase
VDGISKIPYWNRIYSLPVCFIEGVESNQSAIEGINSSLYGNTSVIYTNNKDKIYEIGEQLDVGVVYGNRWGFSPGIPYSPRKRSGKGHSFSIYSYPNVVKLQSLKGIH